MLPIKIARTEIKKKARLLKTPMFTRVLGKVDKFQILPVIEGTLYVSSFLHIQELIYVYIGIDR